MKVLIELEEVKKIVEKELRSRNIKLKADSANIVSHIEGQYDDAREVLDGISFEMES